jgi:hypothetical protein
VVLANADPFQFGRGFQVCNERLERRDIDFRMRCTIGIQFTATDCRLIRIQIIHHWNGVLNLADHAKSPDPHRGKAGDVGSDVIGQPSKVVFDGLLVVSLWLDHSLPLDIVLKFVFEIFP